MYLNHLRNKLFIIIIIINKSHPVNNSINLYNLSLASAVEQMPWQAS